MCQLYVSGHLPVKLDGSMITGSLGPDGLSLEEGVVSVLTRMPRGRPGASVLCVRATRTPAFCVLASQKHRAACPQRHHWGPTARSPCTYRVHIHMHMHMHIGTHIYIYRRRGREVVRAQPDLDNLG